MRTALFCREVAVQATSRSLPADHPIRDPDIDVHPAAGGALHAGVSEHWVPVDQVHPVLFQVLNAAVVLGVEVDRHHVPAGDDSQADLLAQSLSDRNPLQQHLGRYRARMADQLGLTISTPERWVLARDRGLQGAALENRLPLTGGLALAAPGA